jgi:HK97 family phage portal protein
VAVVQSEGTLLSAHEPRGPGIRLNGNVTYFSGDSADYAAIYRTQPNVRLVVSFLARNVAQLGIAPFQRSDDDGRARLDRGHELSRFLRRPNPFTTRYRWLEALVSDLKVYDTFAALKVRHPTTGQLCAFRIPPFLLEPIGSSWIAPEGFRLLGNKSKPEFSADQVLYVHGYNPSEPRGGVPPMETLRRIIAEDVAAAEWREQYLKNGARINGVIERPLDAPKWQEPGRARFRAEWQSAWAGSSSALAGATPVLEEGMTWKEASFSPKDSEYLAGRILARGEVAAQFHVNPVFVGILDHANFSNMAESHKHLYQDTLGPDLTMLEEELELQVLPEFPDLNPDEVYVEFNLAEKLKGTFEEQAGVLQTSVGAPWLTRNEARARQNLAPIDGGDALVTPLNVLIGGQASPRDSAPGTRARKRRPALAGRKMLELGSGRKAADDLPHDVRGWNAKHVEVLSEFFDRQAASVVPKLTAGKTLEQAFDADRWNTELRDDLLALAHTMAEDVAGPVADDFGGTFDVSLAEAWLTENARIAAENVNEATRRSLEDALSAPTSSGTRSRKATATTPVAPADDEEDDVDPLELVAGIFAVAASSRAEQIAVSRVTSVGNFARHEAAKQAGAGSKTWVVNSTNSRHPELDGETVPIGDTFSNGALWPGDPSLSDDDRAGCVCSLELNQ